MRAAGRARASARARRARARRRASRPAPRRARPAGGSPRRVAVGSALTPELAARLPSQRAFLAYRVVGGTALVSGDPIGDEAELDALVGELLRLARLRGWRVAVLGAGAERLPLYRAHGLRALPLGDEAVLDPPAFSLGGRETMRTRPLLLILDEPTSALDAHAEHALFERYAASARAVARATGGIAVFVSHRFSTVRMADRNVVVEDGRIAQQGSHHQLVRGGGLYAELYALQAAAYAV